MPERVVLVDAADRTQATAAKQEAHVQGWLHRAFSVFIFDRRGRLLLQRRAPAKYHSGGLWSNTCCSHPVPDEPPAAAARRRLQEEMGFSCDVRALFGTRYRASVEPGLTEHEYDHVFVGRVCSVAVDPAPDEVSAWRWCAPTALREDVAAHPDRYTPWFRLLLDDVLRAALPLQPNGTGA